MNEGTPAASTRCDVTLAELERELEALLVEYESLSRAWPKEPHAVTRAEIGRKVEDALARIGELQYAIATSPARTLADAAVKLRRLDALLDGQEPERRLLTSALAVVETAHAEISPTVPSGGQKSEVSVTPNPCLLTSVL